MASIDRREFARLFALGGSAALLTHPALRDLRPRPLAAAQTRAPDWSLIREQFLIPDELAVMNAANLCPSTRAVLESVYEMTERMDSRPVPTLRNEMHGAKEPVRETLAMYLRASPEEILITRNTSESNNWVSSGLDLRRGDEVLIYAENHASNNQAWKAKAERFGYSVREIEQVNPHPGPDHYVEAFRAAITPATKVISFTHLTNTSGDVFPAAELCRMARELGVLSVVDGAQTFGLFDVDLSVIQPDFYTGNAHKWPCGPKEVGVLYVNRGVHERFWPSVYSAYSGQVGLSRSHEGMGQRDEPAIHALGVQLDFLAGIGMAEIEARSRELASALIEGLTALGGVTMWTSRDPALRAAVVSFQPGSLQPSRVLDALERDGVVAATRGGARPGIRLSPHFYNSFEDVERSVAAIDRYLRTGV